MTILIKLFFIVAFVVVLVSLGFALSHIVRHKNQDYSRKTAKALSYRIGGSLLLFMLLVIAYATGLIKPQGIGVRIKQLQQQAIETPNKIQKNHKN